MMAFKKNLTLELSRSRGRISTWEKSRQGWKLIKASEIFGLPSLSNPKGAEPWTSTLAQKSEGILAVSKNYPFLVLLDRDFLFLNLKEKTAETIIPDDFINLGLSRELSGFIVTAPQMLLKALFIFVKKMNLSIPLVVPRFIFHGEGPSRGKSKPLGLLTPALEGHEMSIWKEGRPVFASKAPTQEDFRRLWETGLLSLKPDDIPFRGQLIVEHGADLSPETLKWLSGRARLEFKRSPLAADKRPLQKNIFLTLTQPKNETPAYSEKKLAGVMAALLSLSFLFQFGRQHLRSQFPEESGIHQPQISGFMTAQAGSPLSFSKDLTAFLSGTDEKTQITRFSFDRRDGQFQIDGLTWTPESISRFSNILGSLPRVEEIRNQSSRRTKIDGRGLFEFSIEGVLTRE